MSRPVRIANCSGFYGDRFSAAREMLAGPIDVLTGDYLAELTMLILWKARRKDESLGYATTFLRQMQDVLGTCLERGIKVVANAGGLNPAGLAAKITEVAPDAPRRLPDRRRPGPGDQGPAGRRARVHQPRHRRAAGQGRTPGGHRQRLPRRLGHRGGPSRPARTS